MRGYGRQQHAFLLKLQQKGKWYPGCGWCHENDAITKRLAESLIKHGAVKKVGFAMSHGVVDGYVPT